MSNVEEIETETAIRVSLPEQVVRQVSIHDQFEIHKVTRITTHIDAEFNGVEGDYDNVQFRVWGYPLTSKGERSKRYPHGTIERVYGADVCAELNEAVKKAVVLHSLTPKVEAVKVSVFNDIPYDDDHTWTVTGNFGYPPFEDNHAFEAELKERFPEPRAAFDTEAGQFFAYVPSYDHARRMTEDIGKVLGKPTRMVDKSS